MIMSKRQKQAVVSKRQRTKVVSKRQKSYGESELTSSENTKNKEKPVELAEKHPGFKKVAQKIAKKQGVSAERAKAMLAASTRKASASAKQRNPRLKRVKGKAK